MTKRTTCYAEYFLSMDIAAPTLTTKTVLAASTAQNVDLSIITLPIRHEAHVHLHVPYLTRTCTTYELTRPSVYTSISFYALDL